MSQQGITQAVRDDKLDLTRWAENMVKHLQNNFETQNIWPRGNPGPYIGYRNTPAARQNTGDGINSIYAALWAGANGDTDKISFFFNYYLYFVDMGVGAGQPIGDVNRSADARWGQLYHSWKGEGDRQSRPMIAMELRHQLTRLEVLVSSYYQEMIGNGAVISFTDQLSDIGSANKIIR